MNSQKAIAKLENIFSYLNNKYPGLFLITRQDEREYIKAEAIWSINVPGADKTCDGMITYNNGKVRLLITPYEEYNDYEESHIEHEYVFDQYAVGAVIDIFYGYFISSLMDKISNDKPELFDHGF